MAGNIATVTLEEPLLSPAADGADGDEVVAAELGAALPRGVLAGSVGDSSGAAYASELNFGVACNVETVADEWATGLCDCCAAPASRYVYVRVCTHVSARRRFFCICLACPPAPLWFPDFVAQQSLANSIHFAHALRPRMRMRKHI
jgi:hypothetical protein